MLKPSIAAVEPGLRALVTAGAAGIGRAIAERLAEAGARLWVCDVDEGALGSCREAHPDWGHTQCDVADPEMLGRMFEELAAAWGGLDVLVNNAGIAGPTKSPSANELIGFKLLRAVARGAGRRRGRPS
jgi:NAD(P)-dependent dehydrogenase (short-subunit alcohol dehydrogenase family)